MMYLYICFGILRMIVDADGLFLVSQNLDLVRGYRRWEGCVVCIETTLGCIAFSWSVSGLN